MKSNFIKFLFKFWFIHVLRPKKTGKIFQPIPLGEDHYIYDIWINPKTGDDVYRCPWSRSLPKQEKYICRIHDVKPEHCRKYPRSRKHAEETGCRGF